MSKAFTLTYADFSARRGVHGSVQVKLMYLSKATLLMLLVPELTMKQELCVVYLKAGSDRNYFKVGVLLRWNSSQLLAYYTTCDDAKRCSSLPPHSKFKRWKKDFWQMAE